MTAFRGRFDGKIDPKGRIILPSAYRQTLPNKSKGEDSLSLVVTNSLYKGKRCLDVYSLREWEKLEQKIAKMPALKAEVQAYQRFYLASGQPVPLDSQNRLLIPAGLRRYADLSEDVVLVGMGKKFELWSAHNWNELYEGMATQFDEILAAVAELDKDQE